MNRSKSTTLFWRGDNRGELRGGQVVVGLVAKDSQALSVLINSNLLFISLFNKLMNDSRRHGVQLFEPLPSAPSDLMMVYPVWVHSRHLTAGPAKLPGPLSTRETKMITRKIFLSYNASVLLPPLTGPPPPTHSEAGNATCNTHSLTRSGSMTLTAS